MTLLKTRVLVVDDEPRYVRAIKVNLEASGYEVITGQDGQMAVELAADENPDLILLDARMPRLDGFEACRRIREFSNVPIILVTAKAEDADKVQGLDAGADDYVTKPFSADELLARVRAALRRSRVHDHTDGKSVFELDQLRIDYARQRVYVGERDVGLTPTEYRLLCELARELGRVLVPEYLLERVWSDTYAGEIRLVWQAIHRLRQKIETDPHHPRYIQNKPGIGYYLSRTGDD